MLFLKLLDYCFDAVLFAQRSHFVFVVELRQQIFTHRQGRLFKYISNPFFLVLPGFERFLLQLLESCKLAFFLISPHF